MTNQCIVEQRKQIRAVADRLSADPAVGCVDAIAPNHDPSGTWTLEISLMPGSPLLPRLQRELADAGLSVHECTFRRSFDHRRVIARRV